MRRQAGGVRLARVVGLRHFRRDLHRVPELHARFQEHLIMLLSLALWIQATDFFTYLRGSGYVYPSILSLHMVAIALFGGMLLLTDMRLLGLAMNKRPVADLVDQLRVPKRYGFLLVAACGLLMLGCKAEEYY